MSETNSSNVRHSLNSVGSDGSWSGPMDLKKRNIIEKIVLLFAVAIVLGSFAVPIVLHIDYKVSSCSYFNNSRYTHQNCGGHT